MKILAVPAVVLACALGLLAELLCAAQNPEPNYDEAKVPKYVLPDPSEDGQAARRSRMQPPGRHGAVRRFCELFREHMYGHSPGRPSGHVV